MAIERRRLRQEDLESALKRILGVLGTDRDPAGDAAQRRLMEREQLDRGARAIGELRCRRMPRTSPAALPNAPQALSSPRP